MNLKEQEFYNKNILPQMKNLPTEAVSEQLLEKIASKLAEEKTIIHTDKKNLSAKLSDIWNVKVLVFSAALAVFLTVFSFNYYQDIQTARYLNTRLASISSSDYFYAENYFY